MTRGSTTRIRTGRGVLALLALPLLLLGTAGGAQAQDAGEEVVERSVSFTVENTNGTDIACEADGQTYEVRGRLVGPAHALEDPEAVTLFLHGLSYGEFFANYSEQPGYNFAQKQAEDGHVTVVVDRLGYDSSDKPEGAGICFGSQADIAHQMVEQLRSGDYATEDGAGSPSFSTVVLAGHSVGGIIVQAEAYSFGDIDGLMVLSYSDTDVSPAAMMALQTAVAECEAGGGPVEGDSGPGGYVYFGAATPEMFIMAHFFTDNADPTVVQTTASMRNRDPCGDITSYMAAVDTNLANIDQIDVPVLVATGGEDAIYPVPADKQASLLTGSDDVTAVTIPATGHAVTLHRTADEFQAEVSQWLVDRDFGGRVMPVGGVDTGAGGTAGSEGGTPWYLPVGGALLLAGAVVGFGVRGAARRSARGASRVR